MGWWWSQRTTRFDQSGRDHARRPPLPCLSLSLSLRCRRRCSIAPQGEGEREGLEPECEDHQTGCFKILRDIPAGRVCLVGEASFSLQPSPPFLKKKISFSLPVSFSLADGDDQSDNDKFRPIPTSPPLSTPKENSKRRRGKKQPIPSLATSITRGNRTMNGVISMLAPNRVLTDFLPPEPQTARACQCRRHPRCATSNPAPIVHPHGDR